MGDVCIGNHRQRLVFVVHDRVVSDVRDEGQRSFRADDQVLHDVDRVAVVHEGVERVARRILDLVFAADAGLEFGIGFDFGRNGGDSFQKGSVAVAEGCAGGLVRRVENRSVGQDDADVRHRLVGVLRSAAAHAAGIVGHDSSDHRRVDRCGVGSDFPAVFHQERIGAAAPDARLQADLAPLIENFPVLPAVRDDHQHGIADGLAGERCAGCAEGDGDVLQVCLVQDRCDFLLIPGPDDQFGDQPVEGGVGAIGQRAECIVEHPLFRDDGKERFVESLVFSVYHRLGNNSFSSEARMSLAMITPSSSSR